MPTITNQSTLTKQQYKSFGPRAIKNHGEGAAIWAHVRFDDECGNGHNSFAITGSIRVPKQRDIVAGGCLHEEIAEAFPELAKYIKWHLCSTDGPMHYLGNTIYHAGNRDHNGKLAGEPYQFTTSIQFGKNPIKHKFGKRFTAFLQEAKAHPGSDPFDFEVIAVAHENRDGDTYKFDPKYTFGGFDAKWHECPFDNEQEALNFLTALRTCDPSFVSIATAFGKGKVRDMDAARHCAVWPEATDEELTSSDLKEKLEARLPKLLEEFRAAMEELGFIW